MESNAPPLITKSTYIQGLQCPKRFYLHAFRPELAASSAKPVFRSISDVGRAARDLFPGGSFGVEPEETDFSWEKATVRTNDLLQTQAVIYEAAFEHKGSCCIIDMLVKRNKRWYAYEVKGVNRLQQKHYDDITFQYHVMRQAGLDLADVFLVHLNSRYVRNGPIEASKLFHCHSALRHARKHEQDVEPVLDKLRLLSADQPEPDIATGNQCRQPYPCPFISYCSPSQATPAEKPAANREIQMKQLSAFIGKLIYPLYFFDFEAVQYAVPHFDRSSPFQQIPFQYSLHVQESPGAELQHKSFLGDGVTDPREQIMQHLLIDLGKRGSIITWNKTFEATCIRHLAIDFPEYEEPLEQLLPRMDDLMLPFTKQWITLPEAEGKSSLKVMLPLLCPELSYATLGIQEGTMASYTYASLHAQDEETRRKQRGQLLAYCHMDTLAMVKIMETIREWMKPG